MLISMNKMESTQYNAAYTLIDVWKKEKGWDSKHWLIILYMRGCSFGR